MAQKDLWRRQRETMLQDRGALLEEEGDIVRWYKAMHEEHFSSSLLRDDVEGIKEGRRDTEEKVGEEESRSGKRELVREEEKTVVVKRRCVKPFSSDVFDEFGPVDDSGSFGDSWDGFSECLPAVSLGVPVVTDVCLFPFVWCAWRGLLF